MEQERIRTEFFLPQGKAFSKFHDLEAPVVFAGTTITPPALKRPRRDTVDSSPPPARNVAPGNPGTSSELACIMDAPLSQSMDSVNTVATGEDEVRYPLVNSFFFMSPCCLSVAGRLRFRSVSNPSYMCVSLSRMRAACTDHAPHFLSIFFLPSFLIQRFSSYVSLFSSLHSYQRLYIASLLFHFFFFFLFPALCQIMEIVQHR